jgi:methyl-accepting chemotaxis protein
VENLKLALKTGPLSTGRVQIAEKAGEMLSRIAPDSRKTAELVQEISAAGGEHDSGVEQIDKALMRPDQTIQRKGAVPWRIMQDSSRRLPCCAS